jgi:hypothetical protein
VTEVWGAEAARVAEEQLVRRGLRRVGLDVAADQKVTVHDLREALARFCTVDSSYAYPYHLPTKVCKMTY